MPSPLPLRVDRNAMHHEQRRSLNRAMASEMLARIVGNKNSDTVLEKYFPEDEIAKLLLTRAPQTPLRRDQYPAITSFALLPLVATRSGFAQILERCLKLSLDGVTTVSVPNADIDPGTTNLFVAESTSIPVLSGHVTPALLGPARKISFICGGSDELLEKPNNAAAVIGRAMSQAASKTLDRKGFSADAADDTAPAGILHGVTAIPASDSMAKDLAGLVAAISNAGVLGEIVFAMNPARALTTALMSIGALPHSIISSPQIPPDRIIAIALDALASGYEGVPEITASRNASVRFDDSVEPIDVGGGKVMNAFQAYLTLLKLRIKCAWSVVQEGGVRFTDVTW